MSYGVMKLRCLRLFYHVNQIQWRNHKGRESFDFFQVGNCREQSCATSGSRRVCVSAGPDAGITLRFMGVVASRHVGDMIGITTTKLSVLQIADGSDGTSTERFRESI